MNTEQFTETLEQIEATLSVSFSPSSKTGSEIQDAAEQCGAELLGGSSASGTLIYKAHGSKIGAFRAAVSLLGLHASFVA